MVLLLLHTDSMAMAWGFFSYEVERSVVFMVERPMFDKLRLFVYSSDNFFDYSKVDVFNNNDDKRNCLEWQSKIGKTVKIEDINTILYKTSPEDFTLAYETSTLRNQFKSNSFVEFLLKPQSKKYLDYLLFAKSIEYTTTISNDKWESWEEINNNEYDYYETENYVTPANSRIRKGIKKYYKYLKVEKDNFFRERIAFVLLRRFYYDVDFEKVKELYEGHFSQKSNSVIKPLALYFYALVQENSLQKNYLLSKSFDLCDSKTRAAIVNFKDSLFSQTLKLAKNKHELGILYTMQCLRNPGRALSQLKTISKLIPNSEYFSFLINREINKIEEWKLEKLDNKNRNKDVVYCNLLIEFLKSTSNKVDKNQKDYINIALAHLYQLKENNVDSKKYLSLIEENASESIQFQKNIDAFLIALSEGEIKSQKIQSQLYHCFAQLESISENAPAYILILNSLLEKSSNEFYKHNEVATASLLSTKAYLIKMKFEANSSFSSFCCEDLSYYYYIHYLDNFAKPTDLDQLIQLIQKRNKTPFEKYICRRNVASDINVYKDLKGTIALRNNNLELAFATFSQIPDSFWKNNYEFSNYLNENPLIPQILQKYTERKFDYNFSKTQFVKKMIELKNNPTANNLILLGNAYYNISHEGNSWMMLDYGHNEYYNNFGITEDFYDLTNAINCYKSAIKVAKNNEQKALATLMISKCLEQDFTVFNKSFSTKYLKDFYGKYKNTATFKKYNCPLLKEYLN
ncbi:MAG: hypothetical protein RLZZ175_2702 [Bacteroidota bacterium]